MTTTTEQPAQRRTRLHTVLAATVHPTVLLNVIAPLVTYQVLTHLGASDLMALSLATVFPLADVTHTAVRDRRLDAMGALTLIAIAIGLLVGGLTADPHVLLVKDSLVTGVMGLAFLGSLRTRSPMVYLLAQQFVDRRRPGGAAEVTRRWTTSEGFRQAMRRMTLVWGVALLAEAALRAVVSFLVSPEVLVLISPLLSAVVFGPIVAWMVRARRRAAAIPA